MTTMEKRQAAVYFFSFFCFGLILSIIGLALPFLAEHTSVTLAEVSLIFTISSIGFMFGSLTAGRLYDRYPGNILLGAGWCLSAAAAFWIPAITFFPLLCGTIFVFGFANSTIVVGCNTMITRVNREHTGGLLSGMHMVSGIGAFITPLVFTWIITATGDVLLGYRLYCIIFLGAALFSVITPTPEKQGTERKASAREPGNGERAVPLLMLVLLVLTILIYVGTEISFNGWIFSYILASFPRIGGRAGLVTSAFWGCITLGRLTAMVLAARILPRRMLPINFIGVISGLGIIIAGSGSLAAVWIGTIITGYSMGAIFPLLMAFGENAVGLSGRIAGTIFAGTSIGGMVFPFLSGQLFTRFSPNATMLLMLLMVSTAAVLFLFLRSMKIRSYC